MLSAEHLALQHRLVQQLVATREREMNYMLGRYQAIGTQSALVSGFAIGTLTNLAPADYEHVSAAETYIFYIVSMVTVLASMQTILVTVFVCAAAVPPMLCYAMLCYVPPSPLPAA
jgi:hypothetical protein